MNGAARADEATLKLRHRKFDVFSIDHRKTAVSFGQALDLGEVVRLVGGDSESPAGG